MLSTTGSRLAAKDAKPEDDHDFEYPLPWPRSQRWKPRYNVPRNSLEDNHNPYAKTASSEVILGSEQAERDESLEQLSINPLPHSTSFGRTRRDVDTRWVADALAAAAADKQSHHGDEAEEELSNLSHWLETLAELYMNELDNRARFDPRWLNITRRERYEGLQSVTITIFDYMSDNSVKSSEAITGSKNRLASALQMRPTDAAVRVILVNDVSRFVMGTLGQLYNVDPEFWFDHLVSSGYSGSDSGLKLKNAVWMNWAGRETHFRHRALPGPGQRTAWNAPWRTRGRQWAHLRWGRLGLLNYLGRKGFHQDEIEGRLKEGRWVTERDIYLDKRGLLLTEKRLARLDKKRKKAEKKGNKNSDQFKAVSSRTKMSNVYRAYSTFDGLPRNPSYWSNRDLRAMAPEAASYWSGKDEEGRDTGESR
ncbi:Mg2+ transporter protein, CorA-like/Zinc transport protein ZntB [Sarocladium implicatum]|nr:Mg2+ transporter protein, CorA-like/Zinc transport protein ZntB [Sarocladium implicatum]